jgi:hypothetical protein
MLDKKERKIKQSRAEESEKRGNNKSIEEVKTTCLTQ